MSAEARLRAKAGAPCPRKNGGHATLCPLYIHTLAKQNGRQPMATARF
jgi:hypothetical protein